MEVRDVVIDFQIMEELIEPTGAQFVLSDLNQNEVIDFEDAIMGLEQIVGLREVVECGPQQ